MEPIRLEPYTLDPMIVGRIHLKEHRARFAALDITFVVVASSLLTVLAGFPLIVALIVTGLVWLAGYTARPYRTAQTFRKPEFEHLFQPRKVELSNETIHYSIGESDSCIPLESLLGARLVYGHYLLRTAPGQFILIPRTAFRTQSDESGFASALRTYAPDANLPDLKPAG